MRKIISTALAVIISATTFAQTVSDFENLLLPNNLNGAHWNGSDLSGGFASGNAYFKNNYDTAFQAWNGFAYTNETDDTTASWSNQYSAITASGFDDSENYAVAYHYDNTGLTLTGNATGKFVSGFYATNTTYAYFTMLNGDSIFGARKFTTGDWFKLTAKGFLNGSQTADSVDFYLADLRNSDTTRQYILNTWKWVNLLPLGLVDSISFSLSSSDNGDWGMNTPGYFAMDNFTTADSAFVVNDLHVTLYYPTVDTLISLPIGDTSAYTVTLVSEPVVFGATAEIDVATQKLLYTPAVGIIANDTLVFAVTDVAGNTDTARVFIRVTNGQEDTATAIEEATTLNVLVYPNPFSSQISIKGIERATEMEMYNITGALLRKESLNADKTFDFSEVSTGVYILKLQSGNAVSTLRVVKE